MAGTWRCLATSFSAPILLGYPAASSMTTADALNLSSYRFRFAIPPAPCSANLHRGAQPCAPTRCWRGSFAPPAHSERGSRPYPQPPCICHPSSGASPQMKSTPMGCLIDGSAEGFRLSGHSSPNELTDHHYFSPPRCRLRPRHSGERPYSLDSLRVISPSPVPTSRTVRQRWLCGRIHPYGQSCRTSVGGLCAEPPTARFTYFRASNSTKALPWIERVRRLDDAACCHDPRT